MRLIDADKVKKLLTERYEGAEYIEKDIDKIPTAYDVDKVVEKLQRLEEDGLPMKSAINIVKGLV